MLAITISLFSFSLFTFVLAELFYSLSRALQSGVGSAFLYDSLLQLKDEHRYKKVQGVAQAIHLAGNTLSGLLGGLITFFLNVQHVYVMAWIMAFFSFLVSISLKESLVKLEITSTITETIKSYGLHTLNSLRDIAKNKLIIWAIFYSTLIFVLIRANLISLQQPLLIFLAMPVFWFGIMDSVVSFGSAIFSYFADNLEQKIGFKKIFILMPTACFFSFLGMGFFHSKIALLFLFMQMIAVGLYTAIVRGFIQKEIKDSTRRATILSTESLITRGGFALYALLLGFILEKFELSSAMYLTSGLALVGGLISIISLEFLLKSSLKANTT